MTFWRGFWIITGVHFLACMSPGPDFVLVSQQALSRGRAAGIGHCVGIRYPHYLFRTRLGHAGGSVRPAAGRGQNRRRPVSAVYRL